jgi:hypothetical protein
MATKEPCKDGKHCPGFVSNELCQARREAMVEKIDGLKKQIWASAATVGFILSLVEVSLRYGGR